MSTPTMPRPSGLMRCALCPASWRRERALPEGTLATENPAARDGSRLHGLIEQAIMAGSMPPDPEDAAIVATCVEYFNLPDHGTDGAQILCEQEVELKDDDGKILSEPGHVDAMRISGNIAHVFDWKTGRALWRRPAARDYQLLAYAVGTHATFGVEHVIAHRVHPRLRGEYFVSVAEYGPPWGPWEDAVRQAVLRCWDADAPAQAGAEQCAYCRAKASCREFQRWAEPPASLSSVSANELTPARVGQLLEYRERLKMVNAMMVDIEQYAMRLIDGGQTIPAPGGGEYVVNERPGNRKITSPRAINQILDTISDDALFETCTMSVGKLESLFASQYGISKTEAARRLEEIVGDLITRGNPVRKLEVVL